MKVFIHSSNTLRKNVWKFIITLIPLYIYAIYKNGFLLYSKDYINFFEIFKIIYFILLGLVAYLFKTIILRKKIKIDLEFLSLFIVPIFMPISMNYYIYFAGTFSGLIILELLSKYINLNKISFIKLFIILLAILFSSYTYLNQAEELGIYSLNTWDLLWGRNIGGLASTSIVLGLVIMIVLQFTNDYKSLISSSSIITYLTLSLIFNQNLLLNGSNILSFILVAPDSISSPIGKLPKIIYGVLIGLLTVILSILISPFEGAFISILISSIIYEIICKIAKKVL